MTVRVRIIGKGRAGGALALALEGTEWSVVGVLGRGDPVAEAAAGVDLVVIATPDSVISEVAGGVSPVPSTVLAHLAGSLGLDVLAGHARTAAIHPLVALPDPELGSARLTDGAWFATAGDPLVSELVELLGGQEFSVADGDRAAYHAAASIASCHLVAVLGQAERIARHAHVPFEPLMELVKATVRNVDQLGPAAALTGAASRGDEDTIARHLAALPGDERPAYDAMVVEARRLAAQHAATREAGDG